VSTVGEIPSSPRHILGREEDIARLSGLLEQDTIRLVTLTGPGGVGKTRLALEVARGGAGQRVQVAFVDLTPLASAELVLPTIAAALEVTPAIDQPLRQRLAQRLAVEPMLLVLDNFEHVLSAADEVGALLAVCPGLRVLATSREPLHLSWEQEYPVAPLPVPDLETFRSMDELSANPAVALFVARARASEPSFAFHEESAASIAAICVRLDGLPLALELAAARARALPARAMLDRLDHVLDVVGEGPRDAPTRHRTLRAAIGWSYELLEPDLRRLFRGLSVFAGGCDLGAIAAVMGRDGDEPAALAACMALVERSLLQLDQDPGGDPRFRMLETIRSFAAEQLQAAGEADAAAGSHAAFYCQLAGMAAREVEGGRDQPRWLDRCEGELGNFRAALRWSGEHGNGELGVGLAASLMWFWFIRGHWAEGRDWLEWLLADAPDLSDATRAKGLLSLGLLTMWSDDYEVASRRLEESLSIAEGANDRKTAALARSWLATYDAARRGDYARAEALCQVSLAAFREAGDRVNAARVLTYLARSRLDSGAAREAIEPADEAVAEFRAAGYAGGTAYGLGIQALVRLANGDLSRARAAAAESLELAQRIDYHWARQLALQALGEVTRAEGDAIGSGRLLRQALAVLNERGSRWDAIRAMEVLAGVAVDQGRHTRAARLFGGADRLRERVGEAVPPGVAQGREGDASRARRRLGADRYRALHAAGAALTDRELIAEALGDAEPPGPAPGSGRLSTPASPITERERQVAALVSDGLGNREIADRLGITEATAESHVRHIFNKLGVNRRSQIAAWVARQDRDIP
jgi:predicted ATPase/DNA-binding CsgD family transcriptional regulator